MLSALKSLSLPRVVIAALSFLVVISFIASALGGLDEHTFAPLAMAATLVVLLVVSCASSWLLGRLFSSHPSMESALITGLLLWFLYWPSSDLLDLAWFALIAVFAQGSKYLIAWRKRHIINPAAAGVLISAALTAIVHIESMPRTTWWIASEIMFWPVLVAALVVVWRTGRFLMPAVYFLLASTWTIQSLLDLNAEFGMGFVDVVRVAMFSTPIVFLGAFMLTEPLTMPSRRGPQLVAAIGAAVVSTSSLTASSLGIPVPNMLFDSSQELALLLVGVIALATRQMSAQITLIERAELGLDAVEYHWETDRPLVFRPGQYVEIDLPHKKSDRRGRRRAFSPVSVPGNELVFATRHPEPGSSYKQALARMQPGDTAKVTSVNGNFVWPKKGPIVLIGAGIGVTPFLSQLEAEPDRDVVVVVGVREEGQPYLEDLWEISPTIIEVDISDLTIEMLEEEIPDLKERRAFISGRPELVSELSTALIGRVKKIHTDYFWGY